MFHIVTFYKFIDLTDPESVLQEIEHKAHRFSILGSILVATEGINGTVSGPAGKLRAFSAWIANRFALKESDFKHSHVSDAPFRRMTVRLKDEIVSLGVDGINPNRRVGEYVAPDAWDDLIRRDDVMLIDCRNSYEIDVGTFEGAVDPGTDSFRSFADYARDLDPAATPRVAMFCTGGIRCEKATGLMLELGFDEVFHLEGGILRYLEEKGEESETWDGECFVFDRRVSVDRRLNPGSFDLCWACRMPVSSTDKTSELYEEGVSCPRCYDEFTDEDRDKKRQRHRQFTQRKTSG